MSSRAAESEARPWLGLAIALSVVGAFAVAELASDVEVESDIGIALAIVFVALISGLMVAKRPEHPISWLLTAAAMLGVVAGVSSELLPHGMTEVSWWEAVLAIVSGPSWYGVLVSLLVLIPVLFPTGSPPTPRWRWVPWTAVITWLTMSVFWMLQERFCTDETDDRCLTSVANPIGIDGWTNIEQAALGDFLLAVLLGCTVAALTSLFVRYRRARSLERHQIKWVAFSIGLFVLFIVAIETIWLDVLGRPEPPGYRLISQLLWVMIPASIAVAILKYRLYEIDRIISRTVSYALVVALLALVVLSVVTLFTLFLPSDDPLVVAVATLATAALFNPLRRRMQRVVDRRFNRFRYDAETVIEGFAGSLRERVDPEGMVDNWIGVVEETMQPVTVGVWVKP